MLRSSGYVGPPLERTHKEDSGSPMEAFEAIGSALDILKHHSDEHVTFEDKYMNILRDFLSSPFTQPQPPAYTRR